MDRMLYLIIGLVAFLALGGIAQGAAVKGKKSAPCRPGWLKYGSQCFQVRQDAKVTHQDADQACKEESIQAELANLTRHDAAAFLARHGADGAFWVAGDTGKCPTLEDGTVENSEDCAEQKFFICAELEKFAGCPEGFIGFGNFCFSERQINLAWTLARRFCQTVNVRGDLASISSEEEYEFLRSEFGGDDDDDDLWIGLHKDTADTPYKWSNGQKVQYLPWARNYNGKEKSGYVKMSLKDKQFEPEENPSSLAPFLCATVRAVDAVSNIIDRLNQASDAIERQIANFSEAVIDSANAVLDANEALWEANGAILEEVIDAAGDVNDEIKDATSRVVQLLSDCERDWVPFGDNCYKAFFEKTSFAGASFRCRELGAHLPSIQNPFEGVFMRKQLLTEKPSESYWIGLSNTSKGMQWSDGSPLDFCSLSVEEDEDEDDDDFTPFKNCFAIDGLVVTWTPQNCETYLFYACEKPREEDEDALTMSRGTGSKAPVKLRSRKPPAKNEQKSTGGKTGTSKESNSTAVFGVVAGCVGAVVVAVGVIAWRRRSGNSQYTWTQPKRGRRSKRDTLDLDDVKQTLSGKKSSAYGTLA